jgi:uncharacterized protein YcbX
LSGARIAALHLYPLKGARGLALDAARAEITGLAAAGIADRQWMAVEPAGRFITQRETPQLALVAPGLVDGALVLRGRDGTALSLDPARRPPGSRDVVVWRDAVRGHDEGDEAARWLTRQLGCPARLVRFDRSRTRPCNPDYVGDSGAHTLFADGYPLLVIGSASLAHLNERLARKGAAALPMNRFRPNVVIDGLAPHDKPCPRCRVTTTDQATAEVGREPLRTLAEYRYDAKLAGVTFGVNAIVTTAGALGVGDEIAVRPARPRGA